MDGNGVIRHVTGLYSNGHYNEALSFNSYRGVSFSLPDKGKSDGLFSAWDLGCHRKIQPLQRTVVLRPIACSERAVAVGTIQDTNDRNIQIFVAAVISPPHFSAFGYQSTRHGPADY